MNSLSRYNFNQHYFNVDFVFNKPYTERKYRFLVGYDYQLTLISNDFNFFSQSHIIDPRFQLHFGKRWISELKLSIGYDDFYESAFDEDNRDAYLITAGFKDTFRFNKEKSEAFLGFDYERNLASGFNFNYYSLIPYLGLKTELGCFSEVSLDFSYTRRKYVNFQPNPPYRQENIYMIEASIKKRFNDWLEGSINELFVYNDSIANYTYKRNVVSLMVGFIL
jgi:hypothetical protein